MPTDAARLRDLRRMKLVALSFFLGAAAVFLVTRANEDGPAWVGYVRATSEAAMPSATLLDRMGQPMAVPLQVSTREEAGVKWIVVEMALAPFAAGDYAVEVKAGDATRTTAFRVVP